MTAVRFLIPNISKIENEFYPYTILTELTFIFKANCVVVVVLLG